MSIATDPPRLDDASLRQLASTRRTLRIIAVAYALFAALLLCGVALMIFASIAETGRDPSDPMHPFVLAGILLVPGLAWAAAAWSLWTQRGRALALLGSALMMLLFPLGTLVGGLALMLIYGEAGRRLFAGEATR